MTGNEAEQVQSLETVVDFVKETGVDVFAPAIGNAHGVYATTPKLDSHARQRHRRGDRHPGGAPRWHRHDA